MERASETLKSPEVYGASRCEVCWLIVGEQRGGIWLGRLLNRVVGQPRTVEFDGAAVMLREEQRGDVIGFLHTHPDCEAVVSKRDIDTMQAWVSSFGKPLLCLIEGTDGLRACLFENPESTGTSIRIERFKDDWLVAVGT